MLAGPYVTVQVSWKNAEEQASGMMMLGDVVGASEVVPASTDPWAAPTHPRVNRAIVISPGGILYFAEITAIRALLDGPHGTALGPVLEQVVRAQWLLSASLLQATVGSLCTRMAAAMTAHVAQAGEVLRSPTNEPALAVIAPYGRVDVTTHDADGRELPRFPLGMGCALALAPRGDRSPRTQYVARERTSYFVFSLTPRRMRDRREPLAVEARRLQGLLDAISEHLELLVRGLAREPLFAGVSREKLYLLAQSAWLIPCPATFPAPSPIGDLPGLCVVVKGCMYSHRHVLPPHAGGATHEPIFDTIDAFEAGDAFGAQGVLEHDALGGSWRARISSVVAFIHAQRVYDVFEGDATFAENVRRAKAALVKGRRLAALRRPELPALLGALRDDGGAWTPGLQALLLATMERGTVAFRERSVIVRKGATRTRPEGPGNVWIWTEPWPSDADWPALLEDLLHTGARLAVSNVVLEDPPGDPAHRDAFAPAFSRCLLVNVNGHAKLDPWWPADTALIHLWFHEGATARAAQAAAVPPPRTLRAHTTLDTIEGLAASLLDDADARQKLAFRQTRDPGHRALFPLVDRLSRHLTHRSVGLSLSGGESWGFAHIAFVDALVYARIPIDMISGTSSGAVLGTCYSIGGLEMMKTFMEAISHEQAMLAASCLTSVFFSRWLERFWSKRRLEDLEIPTLPVATNVQYSCPEPILEGPAAAGNRLSGSFAPSYPGTSTDEATFVDGAFSANLPADVLPPEGMRLVIASSAMSPSPSTTPRPPRVPGRVGAVLADLNPMRRVVDTYDGSLTLAYAAGVVGARAAARTFQAVRTDVSLFDISGSCDVQNLALSQPGLWETVLGAHAHYRRMCRPRIPCADLPPLELGKFAE